MEKMVRYHDQEVMEVQVQQYSKRDDKFLEMDVEKMKEWIQIKQRGQAEKDKEEEKMKVNVQDIDLDNLMG